MKRILTVFLIIVATGISHAQDIAGDWQGTLNTGMGELRLVLHITKGANGALNATLDSIDQGANGLPISGISRTGDKIKLDLKIISGSFEGTLDKDASSITGTFTQGPGTMPLTIQRKKAEKKS